MSEMVKDTEKLVEDMLKLYPPKVARKRAKHIVINNPDVVPEIEANVRTIPGIITQRGCCYAGCKGVVIGPIIDMVHIVHGPVGCSYYAWMTRRNLGRYEEGTPNYLSYAFTTDMQDPDIIFGGEKKLKTAIKEAYDIFHPKAISVHATCPVGLIGDDVHQVAREASAELGINVVAFSCEGYKGVSQSAGHHIANNNLFKFVVGTDDTPFENKFTINMLGEYNIGGDSWEIHRILNKCGIDVNATLSGDVTYGEIARSHMVNLNLVQCHRSINYVAEMMEKKYGIPWLKVNFIGAESAAKSMRKIACYFEDQDLIDKVEKVIEEEMAEVTPVLEEIKPRTQGKKAILVVGGSRAHHYQALFKEMGMEVIAAGYEFAHRDDYEGREVLPTIKVDADSRNIEELEVEPDPQRYNPRKTKEQLEELCTQGVCNADYDGMMPEMKTGSIVIDDMSHYEMEKMIEHYEPAVFCSGIKDKYVIEKMGIPCKQLHNYDYSGPFAGFKGAVNFYRDIDRMVNSQVWQFVKAPWEKSPQIRGKVVNE